MREPLPAEIVTDRFRLRPWRLADVGDVLAYARDPEWSRFLRLLPVPYTPEDAERFIARQLLRDPVSHAAWALELEGKAVGGVDLRFKSDHAIAEIGYSLGRSHWGRGLCTEAAQAVIDAAFSTYPELNRVHARADERNGASQRVMQKVGMTKEGVLRQSRVERGEAFDEAWFAILRSEWTRGRASIPNAPAQLHIEMQEPPNAEDRQQLTEGLLAHLAKGLGDPRFRSVGWFLRDGGGAVVGGLTGRLRWGWLYVEVLWVADHLRGQGHGARLMREAEDYARRYGGSAVHLEGAPDALRFYERLGYETAAVIEGYPRAGMQQTFMRKWLQR
jgi:ribosomal-protein-alanine N-acetyltransferase